MKPKIDETGFGYIIVDGKRIDHDIVIRQSGKIKKRKKKLSKAIYGTSHIVSEDEAKFIYEENTERIIIGSGQYGRLGLSDEAEEFLKRRNCEINLYPTPEAIEHWNTAEGSVVGCFHVTC